MKGTIITGVINFLMWFGVFSTTLFLPSDSEAGSYDAQIDSLVLEQHYASQLWREKVSALNSGIDVSICQLTQLEMSIQLEQFCPTNEHLDTPGTAIRDTIKFKN